MFDRGVTVETVGFEDFLKRLQRHGDDGREVLDGWFRQSYGPWVSKTVKRKIPSGNMRGARFPTPLRTSVRVQRWRGRWVVGPTRKLVALGTWYESGTDRHRMPRPRKGADPNAPRHMRIGTVWFMGPIVHPGTRPHGVMQQTVDQSYAVGETMLAHHVDEDWARRLGFR